MVERPEEIVHKSRIQRAVGKIDRVSKAPPVKCDAAVKPREISDLPAPAQEVAAGLLFTLVDLRLSNAYNH